MSGETVRVFVPLSVCRRNGQPRICHPKQRWSSNRARRPSYPENPWPCMGVALAHGGGRAGTIENLAQSVGSGERYEPTATIPLLLVTVIASTGYLDYLNRDL